MALFLDLLTGVLVDSTFKDGVGEPLDNLEGTEIEPQHTSTGYGDLVPALGYNEFDGHVYVCGATNSGKSFMINKMLMADKKKREIFLFTDLERRDPSYMPLFDSERMKIVRDKKTQEWEIGVDDLRDKIEGNIILFDDVTDPRVKELRNRLLLRGRHKNIMVVAVNHKMRDWNNTKDLLNDAKYLVAFPNSNRGTIIKYLREEFDVPTKARRLIIKQARDDGRQIIFHKFAPNAIATAHTVFLV